MTEHTRSTATASEAPDTAADRTVDTAGDARTPVAPVAEAAGPGRAGATPLVETIAPPPAGAVETIPVPPGAEVVLSDPAFDPRVARYVVDGEDLVVTLDNGAVLRLEGFFAAEDNPPSLSVLGGPEQTATALLAGAAEAAAVEPAAGPAANAPAHGGGAGFASFDAGDIGEGLTPSGVLPPTELAGGLSLGDLLEGVNPGTGGVGEEGGPLPGEAPEITVQNYVRATAAERSVAFDPASTDRQLRNPDSTDPVVRNGVDPDNLTLDQPREVEVVFQSEEAGFDNTLGVFTIGDDGSFGDVGIVFPNVSQIGDSDGDGTLTPGTRTSLGTFDAGTRLGFF
ncbi:MAG TPA: hypothetical protein ENJ83_05495, partial [Rhodospirillales bacterium]|nr:hypothetical protein [Rhodospirillales bacterium]